jgi:hypothetical protein
MRTTPKNRKALSALVLGFATAAVFSPTASAKVLDSGEQQQASEIPYLSHGATAASVQASKAPSFSAITSAADLYAGTLEPSVSAAGVTPTNLARAYEPTYIGVSQPDGHQPQLRGEEPLVIRDAPDGFQPQTKVIESAAVSASSDGFDRGDLALGFGLGLILATAAAIALAMVRDRDHTQMAHS